MTVFYKVRCLELVPGAQFRTMLLSPLPTLYEVIISFIHRAGNDVLERTNCRRFYH